MPLRAANAGQTYPDQYSEVTVWRFAMPTDDSYALEVDNQHTYFLPIQNAGSMAIASATSQLWVVTEDDSSGTNQVTPTYRAQQRSDRTACKVGAPWRGHLHNVNML